MANVKTTFVVNNPGPLSVTAPEVTLTGSAPIDVKTIAINGIPWPVTWSTVTNWSLRYPLRRVSTELVLASFDRAGGLIPGASHVIQVTYTGPALAPPAIYINEWMASNTRALADNSSGLAKYDDWFELYNAGTETASLEGFFLTDDPANKIQFKIPAGYSIASGGYLLVWADNEPDQNRTTSPDLHVNFQLSAKGESIGLYAPDGEPVDLVTFGLQRADISQGRCPNGSTNITTLSTPSPGAPNQCALATVLIKSFTRTGDQLTLTWQTDAGQRYRIESKDDLNAAAWSLASPEQIANGAVLSATVPILTNHQRFYRVAR